MVALILGVFIAFQAKGILYTIIIFNYPYMGSMLVPLLGGVLWKEANYIGALSAIYVGGIIGVFSFLVAVFGLAQKILNVDLGLFIAYATSALVFVTVSLYTSDKNLKLSY